MVNFVKIGALRAILYLGAEMNVCFTFHIYFPIFPKLTIVDRHIMLLSVHEFHENRWREVRTSLMGLKEITLQCMR